ncbi:WD40 repeat-like protein [Annulohypoxylon nitens]|nr:WD40 repeat-like protein [Annulohypoxylon nitens]
MAGPSTDSFQRALNQFKRSIPPDLANQFSICTLQDVHNFCRHIQLEHGREGKLRNMRRVGAFIEAMEQLGQVIELFVNVNEIVCFVWAPIKFILGIAKTFLDSFDKLLDVYTQLGDAIPGLLQYQATFEEHPPLATVLEDYYSDILRFHQETLSVFTRPRWKNMFHSTWKTFNSKFGPILQSLKKKRDLLESEKISAALYEIHKIRRDVSVIQTEQRQRMTQETIEKHRSRLACIRGKLQASNYQIDQEISTDERHDGDCGKWIIYEDTQFQAWFNNNTLGHGVLYVNGIPGAGKTTLMSTVIENLLERRRSAVNKHCVAYFYFKHRQPGKCSYNDLLRAILEQLIDQDPDMSDHLFDEISVLEGTGPPSMKTLEKLVRAALESNHISYIVLDGLDECDEKVATKSVRWFLSLADGQLSEPNSILRVLFCGQRDGILDELLKQRPSISLEASSHVEDIGRHCRKKCEEIQKKFRTSLATKEDIISRVMNEAKGMFLYARVVLENLFNQTRLTCLYREIEPGTFPRGIGKAYERMAVRLFDNSENAGREEMLKVLGWIICAPRYLRWREIQSMFCIDLGKGIVNYEDERLRVSCKILCGSFVDVHPATSNGAGPEDILKIVHETAREYLFQRCVLSAGLEHAKLAIFCSKYLTSKPFSRGISKEDITKHAVNGYYALQDYAVKYWFIHFQGCSELIGTMDPSVTRDVMEYANHFIKFYGVSSKMQTYHYTGRHEDAARILKELPENERERNAYFDIEQRTISIRDRIELLRDDILDPTMEDILINLHGTISLYKCSKPWCEHFTTGFRKVEDRERHVDRHERPFRCLSEDCFMSRLGYDTQSKLDQHRRLHHPGQDDKLKFPKVLKVENNTTFAMAIKHKNLAAVKALLDSGKDPNGPIGNPPLYTASRAGSLEICKLLIDEGVDVELYGFNEQTSLHAAVESSNLEIVQLLLGRARCMPDTKDKHGRSPFMKACAIGHLDIVKLLLRTGKIKIDLRPKQHPVQIKNEDYPLLTPLGYACIQGHHVVVEYLLKQRQHGLINKDILEISFKGGHKAVVSLLLPFFPSPPNPYTSPLQIKEAYLDWSITFNRFVPRRVSCVSEVSTFADSTGSSCVCFAHNTTSVAVNCGNEAQIYDLNGQELIGSHVFYHEAEGAAELQRAPMVRCLCFSPGDRYLVTGATDGLIRAWNIQDLTFPKVFAGHENCISSIAFSLDGQTIVSGSIDWTVRIWDIESCSALLKLDTSNEVGTVAVSPDTKYVAAGSLDGRLHIWDIKQGQLLTRFYDDRHNGAIFSIAFSPNGESLICGNADGSIQVFKFSGALDHTLELHEYKIFPSHESEIRSVAFTPDSEWIISGSSEGQIQFWDSQSGVTQLLIHGHEDSVLSIASSQLGKLFATSSRDKARIFSYDTSGSG